MEIREVVSFDQVASSMNIASYLKFLIQKSAQ